MGLNITESAGELLKNDHEEAVMIYFFLINNENSITTYSGKLFAAGMVKSGFPVEVVQDDQRKQHILATGAAAAIVFQKCLHPLHQAPKIKHLKGKVGLIHLDDDWMDLDNQGHLETLKITDLILVVSKEHQEALARYTKVPCRLIRSLPDVENFTYYPFELRKNHPLIIAWQQSCADAYVGDLLSIAGPLRKLHLNYQIRLKLYGWHLGRDYPDRREIVKTQLPFAEISPYVPLNEYFTRVVPEIRQADIFIVPYINHQSRKGKGGFGLRRMMLLGVPVVVTALGHHLELITDGINGFLANTDREWERKLESLITNGDLRKRFSINGRKLVDTEFGYEKCLNLFITHLKPFFKKDKG
jgi:glycosyltransferase involved in cell wall biosynthesis